MTDLPHEAGEVAGSDTSPLTIQAKQNFYKSVSRHVRLSQPARIILSLLLNGFLNLQTRLCNPGTDTLVDHSGLGRSTVFAALHELEKMSVIARDPNKGGRGRSNRYTFPHIHKPSRIWTDLMVQNGPDPGLKRSRSWTQRVQDLDPNNEGNSETNISPLAPDVSASLDDGGGGSTSSFGEEPTEAGDHTDALWQEFWSAYPRIMGDRDRPAEHKFRSMPIVDQRLAVRWLPDWLRQWRAEKKAGLKQPMMHMKTWLENREWTKVEVRAPLTPLPSSAPVLAPRTIKAVDTREKAILCALRKAIGESSYESWFERHCQFTFIDDETVRLTAPSLTFRNKIFDNYGEQVLAAVRMMAPACRRVEMNVKGSQGTVKLQKVDVEAALNAPLRQNGATTQASLQAILEVTPRRREEALAGNRRDASPDRDDAVFKDAHNVGAKVAGILARGDRQ